MRQISVPTTIAGGEFSHIAGVTDQRTHVKQMLRHALTIPRATILDPWLSVHTPEWLFLSTGIRAVDHCVEGICAREAHPYSDAQAVKGLSMLTRPKRVKDDRNDIEARLDSSRHLALDRAAVPRRTDGGATASATCGRRVRRAASLHLLRDAAGRDALKQASQCRTSGTGRGPMGQPGKDAVDAATISSAAFACRAACRRPHRSSISIRSANRRLHQLGAARPAQDRRPAQSRKILLVCRIMETGEETIHPQASQFCVRSGPPSSWLPPPTPDLWRTRRALHGLAHLFRSTA